MLSVDRSRVLHTFAHGLLGNNISYERPDMTPFVNTKVITKAISNYFSAFYGSFLTFGTISAGFIGTIFVFRLIKLFFDTIVHGISLYSVYGWSYRLTASFWDSLTGYLVLIGQNRSEAENPATPSNNNSNTTPENVNNQNIHAYRALTPGSHNHNINNYPSQEPQTSQHQRDEEGHYEPLIRKYQHENKNENTDIREPLIKLTGNPTLDKIINVNDEQPLYPGLSKMRDELKAEITIEAHDSKSSNKISIENKNNSN